MDKTEYHQKLDELTGFVQNGDYAHALEIVDSIDWRRVKSIRTLNMAADVYERNKEYQKAKEVLRIAYNNSSIGRNVLARLVEVSLKMGDIDEAERHFREFSKVAMNDNSRCLLQYKIYKAKNAPLDAQIAVLEEYKEKEYTERWAYELAKLYAKAGDRQKCVDTCDDLILWFSEGKYVVRAMELKMRYEPLTPSQKALYSEIKATGYRKKAAEETAAAAVSDETAVPSGDSDAPSGELPAGEELQPLQTDMSTADLEAERIARILSGKYAPEEENDESPSDTEETESEAEESGALPEEDTESVPESDEFASEPDLSDLDEEDDEEDEPENVDLPRSGSHAGAAASHAEPEAFRTRIFRSFQDVFSNLSKEEDESRIQRPDEDEESEEESFDIDVRELEEEEDTAPEAELNPQPENSEYVGMKTEDFNLDDFLSETMGSFAGELASGSFSGASTTVVVPETGSIDLPDEDKAVSGDGTDQEPEASHSPAGVAPSVEESLAALRFELPEVTDEEAEAAETAGTVPADGLIDTGADAQISESEEEESVEADLSEDAELPLEFAGDEEAEETEEPEEAGAAEEADDIPRQKPAYNEELEEPDPEPTEEDRKSRTITLSKIGQNTVPISLDQILDSETPEERRIRILNKAKPTRMSEEQRRIFTYFARIPGMDMQILEALNGVYRHAGERTSLHGNIAVMGAVGTGKSRLTRGLIVAMCRDMGLDAAKVARISGGDMNQKDPARVVNIMSGGFLAIEDVSLMTADTVEKLNQAMEFRTDCMVLIIEDEKTNMRTFLKKHPQFAAKFEKVISVPVFTNDELVTFARTYATENGCKMDDLGILALYTKIGNNQTEEEPMTIAKVKEMVDDAIHHASRGRKKNRRGKDKEKDRWIILHEKDFE